MTAVAFDTLKFARSLRDKGNFTQVQAEGLAEAFAEAAKEQLVLKPDIDAANQNAKVSEDDLHSEIKALDVKIDRYHADSVLRDDKLHSDFMTKLDKSSAEFNAKLDKSSAEFNAKLDKSSAEFNAKLEKYNSESMARDENLSKEIGVFRQEMVGKFNLLQWMLGFLMATLVAGLWLLLRR